MSASLGDNSRNAQAELERLTWEALQRVVVFFWNAVQRELNVSNPRPYLNSSKPGEPPRKRTGYGAGNVVYGLDRKAMMGRVGVLKNAKYMATLELFRNRPWLMATFKKVKPQLNAIVAEIGRKRSGS